ncbi:MAG: hypothetical protein AAF206_01650 [Bacteroidota bacterium]
MKKFVFMLACLFATGTLWGQEQQVALNQEGNLFEIDQKLERSLLLFPQYENFQSARLYQLENGHYALEIQMGKKPPLIRDRQRLNAEEVEALRARISKQIALQNPAAALNQDGRLRFMGYSSLAAVYHGIVVPTQMFDLHDRAGVGVGMLTASAAFFVPLAVSKRMEITKAHAQMYGYGVTRGLVAGIGITELLDNREDSDYEVWKSRERLRFSMGSVSSVVGGLAGLKIAQANNLSIGRVNGIGAYGDVGAFTGLMMAMAIGGDEIEGDGMIAGALLGHGLGLLSGVRLTGKQSYGQGDALMVYTASGLGTMIQLALLETAELDNTRTNGVLLGLGSVSGMIVGHYLTKDVDYSGGQGWLILSGTTGSFLIGAGLGYLVNDREAKAPLLMGALSGSLGFGIMHATMKKKAAKAEKKGVQFGVQLRHDGLMGLMGTNTMLNRSGGMAPGIIDLNLRF